LIATIRLAVIEPSLYVLHMAHTDMVLIWIRLIWPHLIVITRPFTMNSVAQ